MNGVRRRQTGRSPNVNGRQEPQCLHLIKPSIDETANCRTPAQLAPGVTASENLSSRRSRSRARPHRGPRYRVPTSDPVRLMPGHSRDRVRGPLPLRGRVRSAFWFRKPLSWFLALLLEGVLYFLAGLLQVRLRLIALAFGLQAVIAAGFTSSFLALAAQLFSRITGLISQTHGLIPSVGNPGGDAPRAATSIVTTHFQLRTSAATIISCR